MGQEEGFSAETREGCWLNSDGEVSRFKGLGTKLLSGAGLSLLPTPLVLSLSSLPLRNTLRGRGHCAVMGSAESSPIPHGIEVWCELRLGGWFAGCDVCPRH